MDCKKFVIYDYTLKPSIDTGIIPLWIIKLLPIYRIANRPVHTIFKGIRADKDHIYKFISYNNFETNKTKIPEGAKLRKKLSHKSINDNYCGNKIQPTETKEIVQKYKRDNFYYIHDNGNRPFCVYVNKNYVDIYKIPDKYNIDYDTKVTRGMYSHKIASLKPLKVFVGVSSGAKYCDHGKSIEEILYFTGNSILVQTGKYKYVYIGSEIYEFETTNDHIIKYHSPVCGNDVPYPVCEGNKYIYFMMSGCFRIEKSKFPKNTIFEDAYSFYFTNYLDKVTSKILKTKSKDIHKLKIKYLQKRLQ